MQVLLTASLSILLVSCGLPRNDKDNSQRAQQNQGDFSSESLGDSGVSISRNDGSGEDHSIVVRIGDSTIHVSYNEEGSFSNFNGNGAVLSDEDKAALAKAAQIFAQESQLTEKSSFEDRVTFNLMDYLANAPANFAFEANKYRHQMALKNEGVRCIKKSSIVRAEWNTKNSGYVFEDIKVGANWPNKYGCMGRCGSDCGNWWIASSWTKDCMDHDACSARNNASGGASDPNCGDEFTEAADDWLLGVGAGCFG